MNVFHNLFTEEQLDNCAVAGLNSELNALYIANYYKKKKKSVVVVTNSLFEATKLYQSIRGYTKDVLFFPMDDFLTSEALAISPEFKNTRIETLNELVNDNNKIVVTHLMGYLRFLPSKEIWQNSFIKLEKGKDYKIEDLKEKLYQLGYEREIVVNRTGEIAVRGYILDVFPSNSENPIRIEFWGDTIDSIRVFDINTQLTKKEINEILICPNTEFITDKDIAIPDRKQRLLPNYTKTGNINDYLDNPTLVYIDYSQIEISYDFLVEEMFNYSIRSELPTQTVFMNELSKLSSKNIIHFLNIDNIDNRIKNIKHYKSKDIDNFVGNTQTINERLLDYINKGKTVIICLSNRYQINHVCELLENDKIIITDENEIVPGHINLIIKNIVSGFEIDNYIVISEKEIFNKKDNYSKYETKFKVGKKIHDITKLNIGDFIVHAIHGIGIYEGIYQLTKNGLKKDYLLLSYRNNDKLYIPVEKIEYISKYSAGDGVPPKINKLGGKEWENTKLKVKNRLENIAAELLKLYAQREIKEGFAFPEDTEEQQIFETEFIYEETKDQLKVTEDIKKDMEKLRPMDRLVCGDVGYGKTEVAFRAMFKAVMSSKQVALLCPTTILSKQHYDNAIERFKTFPVNIAILNRFVTSKEAKQTLEKLATGEIDILIGTHRILSDDIVFKDLGLLVVDEEQRFGVKHKEKIKQYKANVDVLTLSATPIPRTLQMSMVGLRDLSLIETPPQDRYPVQTYVLGENKQVIKDAIYKELSRNGQIFFLYNHIDTIEVKVKEIEKLVPEARITFAHGQMDKRELEKRMLAFNNNEFDILVCTTIIESGIDIPTVNTLIVINADRYGLSQLYQIRGRVGRSNKIAYAYLMYNPSKQLNDIAVKRLQTIKDFTELGSGFAIAARDLAIRGAGDILGSEQAGFIESIGIELYLKLLNAEVAKLKGENIVEEEDIEFSNPLLEVATAIEDSYVADTDIKIEIHKKINSISSYSELLEVKEEIEDRFGRIDETLLIYMYEEWFEKLASKLNLDKVIQTKNTIELILNEELTNNLDGELLFIYAHDISPEFRFTLRKQKLSIILNIHKLDKHFIYYLIELLELITNKLIKENK